MTCGWLDEFIYGGVEQLRNETFTNILIFITNLGGVSNLIIIALAVAIGFSIFKKKNEAISVIINLLFSSSLYVILKNIIQRPRPPEVERLIEETGYSFPSGHTTNNIAFYLFAIYLVYANIKNKKTRNILLIILAIVPIIIAFSRIYLRVHYPSDVLAGIILGVICVTIFIVYVYPKIKEKSE